MFFDKTWDIDGDGRLSDPHTRIGAGERAEPDSTVIFFRRVATAIEQYRTNLGHPCIQKTAEDRILNDYIQTKTPL